MNVHRPTESQFEGVLATGHVQGRTDLGHGGVPLAFARHACNTYQWKSQIPKQCYGRKAHFGLDLIAQQCIRRQRHYGHYNRRHCRYGLVDDIDCSAFGQLRHFVVPNGQDPVSEAILVAMKLDSLDSLQHLIHPLDSLVGEFDHGGANPGQLRVGGWNSTWVRHGRSMACCKQHTRRRMKPLRGINRSITSKPANIATPSRRNNSASVMAICNGPLQMTCKNVHKSCKSCASFDLPISLMQAIRCRVLDSPYQSTSWPSHTYMRSTIEPTPASCCELWLSFNAF
jgi:hypothetical protein